ncbi:MAG: hypothetical protein WC670_09935 [Pseudolabrys sp.]|jgi:hypothetical protein
MTELDKLECVRLTLESAYLRGTDLADESDRAQVASRILDDLRFVTSATTYRTVRERIRILRDVVAEDGERWAGRARRLSGA